MKNENILYTDYPFEELGDKSGQLAPIRKVMPMSYDGNKYVEVLVDGVYSEIKAGYIYTEYGRIGAVPKFDPAEYFSSYSTKDKKTSMKDEFMKKWAVDGMPADKIRLANAAYDAGADSRCRTRDEEIEAFERMISDNYTKMEKIEKSGENYMHSRTNTAFWVWLARAELDKE